MFSLVPLLVAFAILGIYDIAGNKKIGLSVILFFAAIFFLLFLYQINFSISTYTGNTQEWAIAGTLISVLVLILLPKLGLGDKIFLAVTFFVYQFWLVWIIIILAEILITPIFKIIFYFKKSGKASLPFYPFLFLATFIVYFAIMIIG